MLAALERNEIPKGSVVIIRYEGPKGGPGMPEMLTPTSAIMGAGLGKDVAFPISVFRFPISHFTVAPVDSMVMTPPTGTERGAALNMMGMGLLVVRPSGMKLCPPYMPMSLRVPSWSK